MSERIINLYQKYKKEYEKTGRYKHLYIRYHRMLKKLEIHLDKKNEITEKNKITEKNEIIILSENRPGYGGFGTLAFTLYNYLKERYKVKLIYFNFDGINDNYNDNNIIYIDTKSSSFHYLYLKKWDNFNNNFHNFIIKFMKKNVNDETKIITLTPYTIVLILKIFPEHEKIIYYCGSLVLKNKKLDNIYGLKKKSFGLHPCINKYINKVYLFSTTCLSKYYLEQFTKNKIEIFYPYNSLLKKEYNYNRKIDIIFIVSDISRYDKNFDLVYSIYQKLPYLEKVIIGEGSTEIKDLKNTKCYEFLENKKIYEYLDNSKICLITSRKDIGPSVFVESLQNYCIPILSHNCGFSKLNDKKNYKYVCDFNIENWIRTIDNLNKLYPLGRNFFIDTYNQLLESNCNIYDFLNNI